MAETARAVGVEVDVVAAGGREETLTRPDGERRLSGPLAATIASRLTGSSAAVDAAGGRVTQADDAGVNERVNPGPA